MIAARIKIRNWLATLSYEQIQLKLSQIEDPAVRQDVAYFLDLEKKYFAEGIYNEKLDKNVPYFLMTEGEQSLLQDQTETTIEPGGLLDMRIKEIATIVGLLLLALVIRLAYGAANTEWIWL